MDNQTHSFIVRIWRESDEEMVAWRGLIEYVGQNNRVYFHDLDSITNFIREQVDTSGEKVEHWWSRPWHWIKHEIERFWNGTHRRFKH